uniref:Uncharacterized protein n=1 Tax=Nelumbo nucifera TaxID=4432 RepID=A0A822ZRF8_NELNU|nr:TPA_asm: hypothetical protein HUJ06_003766 [Nelumbo nucifera]
MIVVLYTTSDARRKLSSILICFFFFKPGSRDLPAPPPGTEVNREPKLGSSVFQVCDQTDNSSAPVGCGTSLDPLSSVFQVYDQTNDSSALLRLAAEQAWIPCDHTNGQHFERDLTGSRVNEVDIPKGDPTRIRSSLFLTPISFFIRWFFTKAIVSFAYETCFPCT